MATYLIELEISIFNKIIKTLPEFSMCRLKIKNLDERTLVKNKFNYYHMNIVA